MDSLYNIKNKKICLIFFLLLLIYCPFVFATIKIVAAENVYGSVAKQIGGPYVNVINILTNPAQDPHLFNVNPSTAKAMHQANIIIMNGAGYDTWMEPLLHANDNTASTVMVIADLVKPPNVENPHLWYLPSTMQIFAQKLTKRLSIQDPAHQAFYTAQWLKFKEEYQQIDRVIQSIKLAYQGTPVIATESLFNYMATYLGFNMHGKVFQLSMMNDLPPAISEIKSFEDDLRQHRVQLLIYNKQVINPISLRMLSIAKQENIAIVGLSEMMPMNTTYVTWMVAQLQLVKAALKKTPKTFS